MDDQPAEAKAMERSITFRTDAISGQVPNAVVQKNENEDLVLSTYVHNIIYYIISTFAWLINFYVLPANFIVVQ